MLVMKSKWKFSCAGDRNVTVAHARCRLAGKEYEAAGSSKREKGDVFDPETGVTLAYARALRNLAACLEIEAAHRVAAAEKEKEERASRRIARQERRILGQPGQRVRFSVSEIRATYGEEAAKRALSRRGWMEDDDEWGTGTRPCMR